MGKIDDISLPHERVYISKSDLVGIIELKKVVDDIKNSVASLSEEIKNVNESISGLDKKLEVHLNRCSITTDAYGRRFDSIEDVLKSVDKDMIILKAKNLNGRMDGVEDAMVELSRKDVAIDELMRRVDKLEKPKSSSSRIRNFFLDDTIQKLIIILVMLLALVITNHFSTKNNLSPQDVKMIKELVNTVATPIAHR